MDLSEVINKVESRGFPETLAEAQNWLSGMTDYVRKCTPITAYLLAVSRENFFRSPKEWRQWAEENFKIKRSYAFHSLAVGRMLLAVPDETYNKLLPVSFDKLYSISVLEVDQVTQFVKTNNLNTMTRDQVRKEVGKITGDEPLDKVEKSQFWKAVDTISSMKTTEVLSAVKEGKLSESRSGMKTGLTVIAACLDKWSATNDEELDGKLLIQTEQFLRAQLKHVEYLKGRVLKTAITATTETKTA
jgi:hypothetical protein